MNDKLTDGQCVDCSKLLGCPGVMSCDGFVRKRDAPVFIPAPEFIPHANDCKRDPLSRYYDAGGIEVQDVIKAKLTPEQYKGWCLGNIIKYSLRANFKGSFERDVEKSRFYASFLGGK